MARSGSNKSHDADDMFADTRMSFGEHIEELRYYLVRGLLGFAVAMVLSFFIGKEVLYGFIIYPVERQLQDYYDAHRDKHVDRALKELANDPNHPLHQPLEFDLEVNQNGEWVAQKVRIPEPVQFLKLMQPAQRFLEPRPSFKTFSVTEAFLVYFKICILSGLVLGSPWIFLQIWSFVAAGLYRHEKRLVHVYMPISLALFLAGAFACQFVVLPRAVSALLWFNEWLGFEPDLRLNEWLSFAIILPVIFGISFETPLIMLFLERLGIMTVDSYRSKRKIAFFVLAVISAMNPGLDAFSMLFQWVALCLLYELGIWLCLWSARKSELDIDVPEPEEMVEV
jgi:sec-independent protein translocase protein TatC